jgi:hypothetical protein
MRRNVIVGLVTLTVLLGAIGAAAGQKKDQSTWAIKRALFENYTPDELIDMREKDLIQTVKQLGFDREIPPAEVDKLLCLIGAYDMPYVSPHWLPDEIPASLGKPQPPEIIPGKVDGFNVFADVWYDSANDSCDNTIGDIVCTNKNNDLDQDGKPEIVVAVRGYYGTGVERVVVFENTGDNSFVQVWDYDLRKPYGANPDTSIIRCERVEVTDLDNDGKLEIVAGVYIRTYGKTDYGCLRVFEWTGSDNDYGTAPISNFNLNISQTPPNWTWITAMATGDLDNDGQQELVACENRTNHTYVVEVDGTFETTPTWNVEYVDSITVGSPYAACVGDADGDGRMEFYVTYWDSLTLHTWENTGAADTYAHVDSVMILSWESGGGDDYSWEGTVVANFDGNAYSEVYVTAAIHKSLFVFTNSGDVSNTTLDTLVWYDSQYYFPAAVGDQDHGPGSDGGDIYIGGGGGRVYNYEFTGTDVTNIADYTKYTIFSHISSASWIRGIDVMDSLDLDDEHEVVIGTDALSDVPSPCVVLEHSDLWPHDLRSKTVTNYTYLGQSDIQAVIENYGLNPESGFNVKWSTDTGDMGSVPYSDTLATLAEDTVALGWTADTVGVVGMTVWTDLSGDDDNSNDTTFQNIYVYPPETAQYSYAYTTESSHRIRGIGVFGNDDYVVGVKTTNYSLEYYHNAPADPDAIVTSWTNPDSLSDQIALTYNWGIGIDPDQNVYLANQDLMQSVLVFDYDGNSTPHRLELGQDVSPNAWGYPTALDIDDSGYVYVAYYIYNPAGPENGDQVEVYDKLANWNDVNHTATLMTSFEPPAYVIEGLCVNGDGSVLWISNRSLPPSIGDVTRWTGSPAGGYTQDMTFAGDGTMEVPGFVRAIDLAPDGDIYVCSDDDVASRAGANIIIADGTTGELKYTIDIEGAPRSGYFSCYDVEFSLVGEIDLSAQKAGDDVFLSWAAPGAATAFYLTHQWGWYTDKWEGAGFKGITSYEVYRDTVPDFIQGPATFLDSTSNTYYLDTSSEVGNTDLNHYYIVKSVGTLSYRSNSVTVGEYDKDVSNAKKKSAQDRTTVKRKSR